MSRYLKLADSQRAHITSLRMAIALLALGLGAGYRLVSSTAEHDHSRSARPAFRQHTPLVGHPSSVGVRLWPVHLSANEPLAGRR